MAVCLFLKGPFDNIGQSVDVMCDSSLTPLVFLTFCSVIVPWKQHQKADTREGHMFVLSRMLNENFKYWKRDDLIQVHVSQNHVHSILFFLGNWVQREVVTR